MKTPDSRPLYLSPHLDDAVLSCGGLICQQSRLGMRPLVITCLAGVPDYRALSPFAGGLHQRWRQPTGTVEFRRCEDASAMAYLEVGHQHWDYLDCIYRGHPLTGEWLYDSEEALFGEVKCGDGDLIVGLKARLATSVRSETAIIYAPLAVGHHVDHQVVLHVALAMRSNGFRVRFYEDYPYAEDDQKLVTALDEWSVPPSSTVQTLTDQHLLVKTAAICRYPSQLEVLFGGESFVTARVESYALTVGGGRGYGERYWEGGTW